LEELDPVLERTDLASPISRMFLPGLGLPMDLTRWLQRPPILRELPDEVAAAAAGSRHADARGRDADTRPHLATSGRRPAASGRTVEEEGRKREGRKKKGERG
jgi:hypothetical protein